MAYNEEGMIEPGGRIYLDPRCSNQLLRKAGMQVKEELKLQ